MGGAYRELLFRMRQQLSVLLCQGDGRPVSTNDRRRVAVGKNPPKRRGTTVPGKSMDG